MFDFFLLLCKAFIGFIRSFQALVSHGLFISGPDIFRHFRQFSIHLIPHHHGNRKFHSECLRHFCLFLEIFQVRTPSLGKSCICYLVNPQNLSGLLICLHGILFQLLGRDAKRLYKFILFSTVFFIGCFICGCIQVKTEYPRIGVVICIPPLQAAGS